MDYHEFVCEGTPTLRVVTRDADPGRIPDAALQCCERWVYSRSFRLGDGSHDAELDRAIEAPVAAEGYFIVVKQN